MKIFAIADLHLDGHTNKPMDVFGNNWERHRERIFDAWQSVVGVDDCVLIPGDICWAMHIEDAMDDIDSIAALNGTKILLRGNHDYWWTSPTRMRSMFPDSIKIIQNDAVDLGGFSVAGTRGWLMPGMPNYGQNDEKIYKRELIRLELSLKSAKSAPIIVVMHFPPILEDGEPTGFTNIIDNYQVLKVLYGHLHAQSCRNAFNGELNGKGYELCSADYLGFAPKLVVEI
ncbi:MAG: metallophosphoesterase [Christensenellaceae bacterium]|nr:metallophosphoesterase [Christensenellaceae bacterium]